eukprot:4656604-Prymnesium_polylepis.1
MDGLGRSLAATRSLTTIGDAELRGMDQALGTYHATLGRFGPIFAAFVPRVYEEMTNFKEGLKEWREVDTEARRALGGQPVDFQAVIGLKERYDDLGRRKVPKTAAQASTEAELVGLYESVIVALDNEAAEALRLIDRHAMEAVLEKAQGYGYMSADLVDIQDKLQLKEEDFVQLQLKKA